MQDNHEEKRKFKMALLYAQTRELRKLYEEEMEISPKEYYVVDKDWLDKYKDKNNYKVESEKFKSFNDWQDYNDFKQNIQNSYSINEDEFSNDEQEDTTNIEPQKKQFDKYDFNYIEKGEIINREYFELFINRNNDFRYKELRIGNRTILITDEDNDNYVYSYSLLEDPTDVNNFCIKINSIMMFRDSNTLYDEISEIISCNGINNYLKTKKIDIQKNEEQNIINANKKIIGKFLNLKNEKSIFNPFSRVENPIFKKININNNNSNPFIQNKIPGNLSDQNNNQNNQNNQNSSPMFTSENHSYLSNQNNQK